MKLGMQSVTVIGDLWNDFDGAMSKMQDVGLRYVEWLARVSKDDPGIGRGVSPKEAVKIFDGYGMELTGAVVRFPDQLNDVKDLDFVQKVIDWYAEAGASTIGLTTDYFISPEFFKERMDLYNEFGKRAKAAGMSWVYHNHFHETQKIGDKMILDLMMEYTDPDSVGFCWDVYWGLRGNLAPVETVKRIGHRIKRLHCKDFPFAQLERMNLAKILPEDVLMNWENREAYDAYKVIVPEDFTECGSGIVRWQDVVNAANEHNIPYMFLEQDHTQFASKYESLKVSKAYLEKLNGLELL